MITFHIALKLKIQNLLDQYHDSKWQVFRNVDKEWNYLCTLFLENILPSPRS